MPYFDTMAFFKDEDDLFLRTLFYIVYFCPGNARRASYTSFL